MEMEPELELPPPHLDSVSKMQIAKMIAGARGLAAEGFMAMAAMMVNVYRSPALQSFSRPLSSILQPWARREPGSAKNALAIFVLTFLSGASLLAQDAAPTVSLQIIVVA